MQVLRNALYRASRRRTQIIAAVILNICGLPALAVVTNIWQSAEDGSGSAATYTSLPVYILLFSIITVIQFCFTLYQGFANALDIAPWLHDKNEVDTLLALPENRTTGWLGGFFCGLVLTVAPPALSAAAAAVIVSPVVSGEVGTQLITLILSGIVALIYYYSFVAGVSAFVARKGETVSVPLVLMGVLSIAAGVGSMLIMSGIIGGPVSGGMTEVFGVAGIFSPLGYAAYAFMHHFMDMHDRTYVGGIEIVTLIMSGFWFFAGLFAVTLRKAETTGNAFAFKYIYHAFAFSGVFAITAIIALLYSVDPTITTVGNLALPYILLTLIPFAISYVGYRRGFKKILRGVIIYGGSAIASVLICVVLANSGGFGASEYVPDPVEVKYVYTNFMGGDMPGGEYVPYSDARYGGDYYNPDEYSGNTKGMSRVASKYLSPAEYLSGGGLVKFENPDTVARITEQHRAIIKWEKVVGRYLSVRELAHLNGTLLAQRVPEYNGTTPLLRQQEVTYVLNNGNTVHRSYICDVSVVPYSMNSIYYSDELKNNVISSITQPDYPYYHGSGGTEKVPDLKVYTTARVMSLDLNKDSFEASYQDDIAVAQTTAEAVTQPEAAPAEQGDTAETATVPAEQGDTAETVTAPAKQDDTAEPVVSDGFDESKYIILDDGFADKGKNNKLAETFFADFKARTAENMEYAVPEYIIQVQRNEVRGYSDTNTMIFEFYVTNVDVNTLAYIKAALAATATTKEAA